MSDNDIARAYMAPLTCEQKAAVSEIKDAVNGLWGIMLEFVPDGPEKTLARRYLEISSFWAVKAATAEGAVFPTPVPITAE